MDLDEKAMVRWLREKLEELVITDSSDLREQIEDFCSDLFSDQHELYQKLKKELLEVVDEIAGMDDIGRGKYEAKILHMGTDEVEKLLEIMRKIEL